MRWVCGTGASRPSAKHSWIGISIHGRQGVQFVQAGNDAAVFDVSESANVKNEFRPPPFGSQLEAGALDIAVSQSQSFARLTQAKTGKHVFLKKGFTTEEECTSN